MTAMSRLTSFECVVSQALMAHPDDAHRIVEKYLLKQDLSSEKTELFRRAWAKVSLESRAFGAKGVAPEVFASELLSELTRTWYPTLFQMQQHAQTLRSQASHEKYDAASVREQMSFLHEDVTGILRNVLDRRLSSRRYPPVEEAIDNATSSFKVNQLIRITT